ncbi:MAG: IS200/IS605 family element transposase accessory protein TnpB [Moorea sp. SIO2B7]|nr:IS200/IS605 family element transposase accessory protein TnpB [Moorena sp. SIO2B7]
MARKKSPKARLTRISRSKQKTDKPVYQMLVGIESKIEFHPFLEDWGNYYQSLLRTALNDRQKGLSASEIEKTYPKIFKIQWAWADSLAKNASQVYDQLITAKENQIEQIKTDIKGRLAQASQTLENSDNAYFNSSCKRKFSHKLLGFKSKIQRLQRKKKQLKQLRKGKRLHICWVTKKLFKAQYHREENGYSSHEEWLSAWRKKRRGNFYSVGKRAVDGNNPVTKIHHRSGDLFTVTITVPRCYQEDYGNKITLKFESSRQQKTDIIDALEANKPVTVKIFIREQKDNQWYIHFSTYVQAITYIYHKINGDLGIDLNAKSIDIVYLKMDGNLDLQSGKSPLFSWTIPTGSTGQFEASLRDKVVEIVRIAESYQCLIACEGLDFSKKKATLRHKSSDYKRMLSRLIYAKFRANLVARAEKYGIEVIFKNPSATSTIGMIKYMPKYGLNSAYAAAMVIARQGLGFSERIPRSYWSLIGICTELPEDGDVQSWDQWEFICKLLSQQKISRHQMFESAKVLEALQLAVSQTRKTTFKSRRGRKVKSAFLPVVFSNSNIHGESPMPQNC